jgi:hypothetical protein
MWNAIAADFAILFGKKIIIKNDASNKLDLAAI